MKSPEARPRNPNRAVARTVVLALALVSCSPSEPRAPSVFAQADGDSPATAEAKRVYGIHCALCHGANGRGMPGMPEPKPRDLTDPAWQDRVTDTHLKKVIREGGPAVGLHPTMAATDRDRLSDEGLEAMIPLIRALRRD